MPEHLSPCDTGTLNFDPTPKPGDTVMWLIRKGSLAVSATVTGQGPGGKVCIETNIGNGERKYATHPRNLMINIANNGPPNTDYKNAGEQLSWSIVA